MCWNASVSLNTFLFSFFSLLLIIYNNKYTQYKIQEINSFWIYIFFLSFIFMQLIEYFIWTNINNDFWNRFFTILAYILLCIQPICSLMIIQNKPLRNKLLVYYSFVLFIFFIILMMKQQTMKSYKDKMKHLVWYSDMNFLLFLFNDICYTFFLLIGLFIEKKWAIIVIGLLSFFIVITKYLKNINNFKNSSGSVWCWYVNLIMLYYLLYLLIYLPFIK